MPAFMGVFTPQLNGLPRNHTATQDLGRVHTPTRIPKLWSKVHIPAHLAAISLVGRVEHKHRLFKQSICETHGASYSNRNRREHLAFLVSTLKTASSLTAVPIILCFTKDRK